MTKLNPPAGTRRRAPRPRGHSSADALSGGAVSRSIVRLVTLPAVAAINVGDTGVRASGVSGEASSTGETRPKAEALLLAKLSFHFDGFLVIEGVVVESDAGDRGAGASLWPGMVTDTAYVVEGSNGRPLGLLFVENPLVLSWVDDARDAMLISHASACEAAARVSSVSSLGDDEG